MTGERTLPESLAQFCAAMRVAPGMTRAPPGAEAAIDAALAAFAMRYPGGPRAALVSFWSQYYLPALIAPATAALLVGNRALPVALSEMAIEHEAGVPAFRLRHAGVPAAPGRRFATLVEDHIAPFVALCATRSGAAPRLFWANAAVTLDWVLGELDPFVTQPAARDEARALLDGGGGACRLAHPLVSSAEAPRRRRLCCLRYRLAGVGDCGALCPRRDRAPAPLARRAPIR